MGNKTEFKLISVIMPTYNRYDIAIQNIKKILDQDYPKIELIVCDDSDKDYYLSGGNSFKETILQDQRVKYEYCARFDINGQKDYGLARARNFGIIHATGEFLIFLDDRITPAAPNAFKIFAQKLEESKEKIWYFGDKGGQKTSFVENFSAVKKSHVVDAGYFFERIDKYGGMTREIFARYSHQGFKFQYVPEAKAQQLCKSRGWDKKPEQITEMRSLLEKLWGIKK
jgi:glycosyltransferase involved in cell wall biosynthesis